MTTLLIFLFILSILIVVHEFGHFMMAKNQGIRVEEFSLGFGPQLFRKKHKGTDYSIAIIPLGGFVKLAGDNPQEYTGKSDEYFSKPPGKRFLVIFFGPLLNYLLGFLFFWLIFFVGYPTLTTKVGGLIDGFGAKQAGLEINDKITAVDGEKVAFWEDLQSIIQSRKNQTTVRLTILRQDAELTIPVLIQEKEFSDQLGGRRNVGLLGIRPSDELVRVRYGIWKSSALGLKQTWDLTAMTCLGFWRMLTGSLSLRDSVTGPLGIFYITSKAASMGIIALLHLIAVLNVSLAIFNLLPLPVLDGGHILLLVLEKIRGKALGLKSERIITRIGLTAIITLALFVTYNDILRFFGDRLLKFFK